MYKRIGHYVEFQLSPELHELSYERSHVSLVEDVYETPNEPLESLVKQSLQTRQVREEE